MFPVSAAFRSAVRSSHRATLRVEVWRSGVFLRNLEVLDGQVEVDARRAQRRTCNVKVAATKPTVAYTPVWNNYGSLKDGSTYSQLSASYANYKAIQTIVSYAETTVDDGLIPTNAFADLAPFGNELRIWRGIEVSQPQYLTYAKIKEPVYATYTALNAAYAQNGALKQPTGYADTVEEVPLGVFVLTEANIQEEQKGATMDLVGVDRSIRIQKAQWIDPFPIASGTNLATALQAVLSNRWADVEVNFSSTTQTVPQLTLGMQAGGSGRDPWGDCQQLASSGGFDLYFDGSGVAVLKSTQDPSDATAVASYVEDAEAMLLGAQRRISTDQTFNGVVVTGEGTNVQPPVRSTLFDEDPASPTYRYGAFGDRPTFISSPLVTSAATAAVVAQAQLSKVKGAEENVDWSQICDPSLDVGDVIYVENTGTRLAKVMVLDKLSIPLKAEDSMKATARTVRVLAVS